MPRRNRRKNERKGGATPSDRVGASGARLVLSKPLPASNPFGRVKTTQMTYTFAGYDGTVNPGFGTSTLSLNDLSSLDGAGANPTGYDQMITVFNRYKVHSADVELVVCPRNTGVERLAMFPTYPDFVPATTRQACERPGAVSAVANMHQFRTLHAKYDLAKLVGPGNFDLDYSGTSAGTTRRVLLRLAWAPLVAGTTYIAWAGRVTFQVVWSEPKVPADS